MPTLQAQQKFERYRIIRWLGNGTSGESYEAEDTVLPRRVTLKLIHPWTPLSDAVRRQFFRDMQDISLFNHPYIAQVLDYGEIDGYLYVVRRYVDTGSLLSNEGRLWYRPPLTNADAIQYTSQLAQALVHIHAQGFVHGALTFTNILVLRTANIEQAPDFAPFLLADCGLAHYVRHYGQPRLSILPVSSAPEQAGKRAIAASDQYALASLCYFWLTGRPPFLGSLEEIEQLKLKGTFASLSSLNSRVPLALDMVIRRALSVYPDERYPSIQAFVNALQATRSNSAIMTPLPFSFPQLEPIVEQQATPPQPSPTPAPPQPQPTPEPTPNPQPAPPPGPQPEILPAPQTPPSPVPPPAPEPLPVPEPDPQPTPTPELVPTPEPEILPQIEPDVAQPLPSAPDSPSTLPTNPIGESALETDEYVSHIQEASSSSTPRLIITLLETEETREFLLEQDEITLGRAGSSDILLEQDNLTSRHHALLKREGQEYLLYDQRSANGVFVNGQHIPPETPYILADGDHIGIGNYEIIFRTGEQNSNFESDSNGHPVEATSMM